MRLPGWAADQLHRDGPLVTICQSPFSFFDRIYRGFWRVEGRNHPSLHQVCAIARRLRVDILIAENVANRQDIAEELAALRTSTEEPGGTCEAIALSFFRSDDETLQDEDGIRTFIAQEAETQAICRVSPGARHRQEGFLGQVILINYYFPSGEKARGVSYIYEALLLPPPELTPETMLVPDARMFLQTYPATVLGHAFKVRASYYCQQNGITAGCGHVAIRTITSRPDRRISTAQINVDDIYMDTDIVIKRTTALSGGETHTDSFESETREELLTDLVAALESGRPALLTHWTAPRDKRSGPGADADHIVSIVGYITDRNLWHPQAIPAYNLAPEAVRPSLNSSAWVRHLIVHDENFGPYRAMGIRSFPSPKNPGDIREPQGPEAWLSPRVPIGVFKHPVSNWPTNVLRFARRILRDFRKDKDTEDTVAPEDSSHPPLETDWARVFFTNTGDQILRPVLIERQAYMQHLKNTIGKNQTTLTDAERERISAALPSDWFWMVELSHTLLFTGIDTKVGELLMSDLDADVLPGDPGFWWRVRLPNCFVGVEDGKAMDFETSLSSHVRAWHHDTQV